MAIQDMKPQIDGDSVVLSSFRRWMAIAIPPIIVLWVIVGISYLAHLEPPNGGWAAVIPMTVGLSLFWILLFLFGIANLIVVNPGWVAHRRLRWWTVIAAADVIDIVIRDNVPYGPKVMQIQGPGNRSVGILGTLMKNPKKREAVLTFLASTPVENVAIL
jgi:hypothetical protein